MRTFHIIIFFSIYLVNATTNKNEDCPVLQKAITAWCKGIDDIFTQDDGQFSKYACGCIEALLTHNFTSCKADEYDFAQMPKCRKLFKSNEYEQLSKKANPFSDFIINVIFKHWFNVCDDNSADDIDKFVKSLYTDEVVVALIEKIFKLVYSSKEATLIIDCYKEAQTSIALQQQTAVTS